MPTPPPLALRHPSKDADHRARLQRSRRRRVLAIAFAAPFVVGAFAMVAFASGGSVSSSSRGLTKARPAHPELGRVAFEPNFVRAKTEAKRTGKPVFILFDEVPGCSTVQGYGADVLSHPLIADAIENEFVPAFVKNNAAASSPHTKVLRAYAEPAWNNPVGRVVDAEGRPLLERLNGDYSVAGTAHYLVDGLIKAKRSVPPYLALLAAEQSAVTSGTIEDAQFSMYCFWSGEVGLGEIPGVMSTEPAHSSAGEIVAVRFDPTQISYAELVARAKKSGAATRVLPLNPSQRRQAKASGMTLATPAPLRSAANDDKYQLSNSPLRFVPMTAAQRTKVNAALGRGRNPKHWLSPRQNRLLANIGKNKAIMGRLQKHPDLDRLWDVEATIASAK